MSKIQVKSIDEYSLSNPTDESIIDTITVSSATPLMNGTEDGTEETDHSFQRHPYLVYDQRRSTTKKKTNQSQFTPTVHSTNRSHHFLPRLLALVICLIHLPQLTHSAIIQPAATLTSPYTTVAVVPPIPARVDQPYVCNVIMESQYSPNSPGSYTWSFVWYINPPNIDTNPTTLPYSTNLLSTTYQKGYLVQCGVTASKSGTPYPLQNSTNVITIVNTPPSLTSTSIQAVTPRPSPNANANYFRVGDTLMCIAAGATDVDDPIRIGTWPAFTGFTFNFTWRVNGNTVQSTLTSLGTAALATRAYAPNNTLNVSLTRGDSVTCTIIMSDAQDWSDPYVSNTYVIGATPPLTTGITLYGEGGVGSPVLRNQSATCAAASITSSDGDPSSSWGFNYTFILNGATLATQTTPALAYSGWIRGDKITCNLTANVNVSDVIWVGDTVASAPTNQVVGNSPSITGSAIISPTSPTAQSNLTCVGANVVDVDGDAVVRQAYKWTKNGVALNVVNTTNMLLAGVGTRGDVFTCAVATYDGHDWGAYSPTASIILSKAQPTISNVSLVFDDFTNPTLVTCQPGPIIDPDGAAPDMYFYTWSFNGVVLNDTTPNITTPTSFQLGSANYLQCNATARETAYSVDSLPVSSPNVLLDSPKIIQFDAFSPSNKEAVYTNGITFNISFSAPVNFGIVAAYRNGATMPKAIIDSFLNFSDSLGLDYEGYFTSSTNLTIVTNDVRTHGRVRIGSTTVSMLTAAEITFAIGVSLYGGPGNGTSPALGGNFGTAPVGFLWGIINGQDGQDQVTPTQFNFSSLGETLTGATAGVSHALLWTGDLHVYGLGLNVDNQMGFSDPTTLSATFPNYASGGNYVPALTKIDLLEGVAVESMAGGASHSLLLTDIGVLYTCGKNNFGQGGTGLSGAPYQGPNPWQELKLNTTGGLYDNTYVATQAFSTTNRLWNLVEAGYYFSLVVRTPADTTQPSVVFAWGKHFGDIYLSTFTATRTSTSFPTPTQVVADPTSTNFSSARISAVSAGLDHVLFLTETGVVWAWGRNYEGQLGLGPSVTEATSPLPITALSGLTIISISTGAYHSIVVANTSAIYCFGKNADKECGIVSSQNLIFTPTILPTNLFNYTYAQYITAADTYSIFTNYNGDVYGFGYNQYHGLGVTDIYLNSPTYIASLKSAAISRVFTKRDISVAITPNKESPCLRGCNNHGTCYQNECQCTPDWTGIECQTPICPKVNGLECAGNGTCATINNSPTCVCNTNFGGPTCTDPSCAIFDNCGLNGVPHGACKWGVNLQPYCTCDLGWKLSNCSTCEIGFKDGTTAGTCDTLDCSAWNSCSGQGTCQIVNAKGACVCADGWAGLDCKTPFCTGAPICSGHGSCLSPAVNSSVTTPTCLCDDRWTGTQCATYTCVGTPVCSSRGTCDVSSGTPTCKCNSGWISLDCSIPSCSGSPLNDCSGHGTCVASDSGTPSCDCDSSYSGADCSNKSAFAGGVLIALIVVGVVLGVILITAGGCFLYRRHTNQHFGFGDRSSANFFDPIAKRPHTKYAF